MKNNRFSSLDGLRAYAAIGILLMHVQANVAVRPEGGFVYDTFIPSLTHFVYLFLLVSAFSLCCGYYEKFKTGSITPNAFYMKRYSRILPFFAILVVIDTFVPHAPNKFEMENMTGEAVTGVMAFVNSLYDAFAELTLTFNLLPNPKPPIGVAWFLGVIFLFYMLFPYFVFMMDNKQRAWKSLGLAYLFCFAAISYFLTDNFINWEMTRHSIVYDGPFLVWGGIIFLYRYSIVEIVGKYHVLSLVIAWGMTCIYWFTPQMQGGFSFVVIMTLLTVAWLCYAIGTSGRILNNLIVRYLSGISMEIYLCHMMSFRAVQFLHIEKFIGNIYVVYWITCIITLCVAVAFSHVTKYYVLPQMAKLLGKKE